MKDRDESVHDLVMGVSTIWNSTYEMFLSVLKSRKYLEYFSRYILTATGKQRFRSEPSSDCLNEG